MKVHIFQERELTPEQRQVLDSGIVRNAMWVRPEDPSMFPFHIQENGDWVDLKLAEDVNLKKGQRYSASLGFSAKLPKGYEAHVVPRSSTYIKWHIIQTNGFSVIDESYCGNGDIWHYLMEAAEDTKIEKGTRIAQFRVAPKMRTMFWPSCNHSYQYWMTFENASKVLGVDPTEHDLIIVVTDDLGCPDRGGIGSTGTK